MPKSKNPYSYGKMITDSNAFFGRKNEISLLVDHSKKMQNVSLLGKRRIGKSSILLHYTQTSRKQISANVLTIYIDFQDERVRNVEGFVNKISEKIISVAGSTKYPQTSNSTLSEMYAAIEAFYDRTGIKIVLCFDEFELLGKFPVEFNNQFFDSLRSMGQTEYLSFFIASRNTLYDFCISNEITSPFHNIFLTIYLGNFTAEEAEEMITNPARNAGISFSKDEISYALRIGGGHPFYTQMLCYFMFQMKIQHKTVDFEILSKQFRLEAWPNFKYLWDHMSEESQLAIHYFVSDVGLVPSAFVVDKLQAYGLLKSDNSIFSIEFGNWVKENARISTVRSNSSLVQKEKKEIISVEKSPASGTNKLIVATIIGLVAFLVILLSLSIAAWLLPESFKAVIEETKFILSMIMGFILALTGYVKASNFLNWLRNFFPGQ